MKVVIIGGPGTAICIADQITDAHVRYGMDIEVIGLALDDHSHGEVICGYPILCDIKEVYARYKDQEDVKIIFSLYRPDKLPERAQMLRDLEIPENKFFNFIHPSALVARSARLGVGNVVLANAVVNSNASVGNYNVVNVGVLLGHDIVVGNNNFFAAHSCIGSGLRIGNANFFGLNASVRNGAKIGNGNIIGMASNITKDVSDVNLLYGNPAVVKPTLNHKMG